MPNSEKLDPAANVNVNAGLPRLYSGNSDYINANRQTSIRKLTSRATITNRQTLCYNAIAQAHGTSPFIVRGLDNGILANLRAAGLLKLSGGTFDTASERLIDQPNDPVIGTLTVLPAPVKTVKTPKSVKPKSVKA